MWFHRDVEQNVHQGGFLATRSQIQRALARGCLTSTYTPHWAYHEIETADTQLYYQCELMKVVPLPPEPTDTGTVTASVASVAGASRTAMADRAGQVRWGSTGSGSGSGSGSQGLGSGSSATSSSATDSETVLGPSDPMCQCSGSESPPATRRGSVEWSAGVRQQWADDMTIHHTPDKYVRQDGVDSSHNFFLTLQSLLEWMGRCALYTIA